MKEIEAGKRLTAGLLVSRGIHSLNDPSILERIRSKRDNDNLIIKKQKAKARKEKKQTIAGVKNLRMMKPDINKWNQKECSLFIRYKRIKTDTNNPTRISELRERCKLFSKRRDSPHCSEDEDEDDDQLELEEALADLGNTINLNYVNDDDVSIGSNASCMLPIVFHNNRPPATPMELIVPIMPPLAIFEMTNNIENVDRMELV